MENDTDRIDSCYPEAGFLHFLWAGLVKHGQTGGIVPSQRFLIDRMIAPVPVNYRGQIVELGAGNGALTLRLAAKCPVARILACEINPTLARDTRHNVAVAGLRDRVEVIAEPAESLLSSFAGSGKPKPDYVLSGIPLGSLGGDKVRALIGAIHRVLGEGGLYIQFQHSLLDYKKIRALFDSTRITAVLLNFPPAVIYYARKRQN
jgi:phospholipid N-methyltransferase